jgi:hypothetical protein
LYDAAGVDSSQLTSEQFERMFAMVSQHRDYLWRLVERMRVRRFPADDPVYRAALTTYEKASNLCVVIASCRERLRGGGEADQTIMMKKPWGGDRPA